MSACPSFPEPPALKQLGALYAEFGADLPRTRARTPIPLRLAVSLEWPAVPVRGGDSRWEHPSGCDRRLGCHCHTRHIGEILPPGSGPGALRRPDAATFARALTGRDTAALETLVAARAADAALMPSRASATATPTNPTCPMRRSSSASATAAQERCRSCAATASTCAAPGRPPPSRTSSFPPSSKTAGHPRPGPIARGRQRNRLLPASTREPRCDRNGRLGRQRDLAS